MITKSIVLVQLGLMLKDVNTLNVYVRSITDFRILGRPPGEIYGIPYEDLDTRMVRRKVTMK